MGIPVEQMTPPPPPPAGKTNALAVVSLIVGIVGLIGICIAVFIPIAGPICTGILAVAAIVTGFLGMNQANKNAEKGRGMAIAGLIIGVVTILAACLIGIGHAVLGPQLTNFFNQMSSGMMNSLLTVTPTY
jgi:uncharacterized membrane protein YphA (DoxX/SURF4 family)